MDSTLEKIYSITPEQAQEYNKYVMLGNGGHGLCFQRGKGVRLWDNTGKSYIDCTSQGWAMYLGHSNDEIRQVVYEHMENLSHLNQNSDSLPRYALAKRLVELAPEGMNRVLFAVGGSSAIEAAMKIAVKNVPAPATLSVCRTVTTEPLSPPAPPPGSPRSLPASTPAWVSSPASTAS